jgi:acyl-CoA hydrolase
MPSRFPSAAQKTTRGDDMNYAEEYARRCVSADEAVKTVASGDVVDYGVFK